MIDRLRHHSRTDRVADNTRPVGEQSVVPFWEIVVLGVVTTLFGLAVLVWPSQTLRTLGVLVGIWLLVAGAARVVGAFVTK